MGNEYSERIEEYKKYKTRTLSAVESDYIDSIRVLENIIEGKK